MRIGLISTIDTNIGDDFIREGIVRVLDSVFGPRVKYVVINKHDPETYYPLVKLTRYLPDGRTRSRNWLMRRGRRKGISRFDDCDLIVQCGAPVYWEGCGTTTQWRDELWYGIIDRLHERIPILNLAAGSCYPLERLPSFPINETDADYIRRIHGYCKATAVRDPLALRILESLGLDGELIPCSACLAPPEPSSIPPGDGLILINYMEGGGHYDWNQGIDKARWESEARSMIDRLRGRHRLAFICHDEKEEAIAAQLDGSLPRFRPRTPREYQEVVRQAKLGICCRLHAAVYLAGFGVPAVALGTDTRLHMVKEFGLPCMYVKEATAEALEGHAEGLLKNRHEEWQRLTALRRQAFDRYKAVVEKVSARYQAVSTS